ncbi:helix-turn-helix transcriptional regulator [Plantactinospora sp. KBS50]|uniref:helix-turn-helix transcriptional regulator n=1 Tax=Plantactinospora sp. KBS50 TaxID=2024580 RepID=UPI000BAAD0AC|nr:helix-turn-helix transcriptional regulator [Plantactinospora sp. KBS50]ASW57261.1 hypothetical protein CIK06_28660 [Plantactinospora sp. KBS50]
MATYDEALLRTLKRISSVRTLDAFGETVTRELYDLMPCVSTSYNELNPTAPKAVAFIYPDPTPEWWAEFKPPFEKHMTDHPVLRAFAEWGEGPPTTWDDVDPAGAFTDTPLYRTFYEPLGIRSQIAFEVPAPLGVVVGVSVNRDGSPFTGEERALVTELREHLIHLHRLVTLADRARLSIEVLGLTPRQAEVAMLLHEGLTNSQIARRIGVGESTVRKHLDVIFRTLGVRSRAAAVTALLTVAP